MYEISDEHSRRPGQGSSGQAIGPGTLPVLFHLMDVSRPRPSVDIDLPSCANGGGGELSEKAAASHDSEAPTYTLAPAPTPPLALAPPKIDALTHCADESSAPISLPPAEQPLSLLNPVTSTCQVSVPAEPQIAAGSDALTTTAGANVTATETVTNTASANAAAQHPVTPRSQIASRQRTKTSASEDWFAAHGKFIAVGFVLALIGTIYFARTNRQPGVTATAASSTPPAVVDTNAGSTPPAINAPKLVEHSPPAVDSKVELQPPVAAQVASGGSTGDKPAGNDNLFVFPSTKPPEERVASRSDATGTANAPSSPQPPAAPAATSLPPQAAAAPAAPPPGPSYPTTASPSPVYPVTASAPDGYPAPPTMPATRPYPPPGAAFSSGMGPPPLPQPTNVPPPNYRSQFPTPGAPAAPPSQVWPSQPPVGGLPGQYQPMDNTARGQRYERTGSGNY